MREPGDAGLGSATVRLVGADRAADRRVTRTTVADKKGRFRFTGVPAGPDWNYVVDTKRQGGYFPARSVVVEPGKTARRVVKTWPTTRRPQVVEVRSNNLYLVPSRKGVSVVESVTFTNSSHAAYIGRGGRMPKSAGPGRDRAATSVGLALPSAVADGSFSIVRSDLPLARIRPATFGFGLVNALPPGEHTILFSYNVTGNGGTFLLTRPALYPVKRLIVFASAPLEVDGAGMDLAGQTVIRGQAFDKWTRTEDFRPLDEMSVAVAARTSNAPGLFTGAGVLVAVLLVGVLIARRRRASSEIGGAPSREHVISAIAELDIRHDAGEIGDEEWTQRRQELKDSVASGRPREPVA
jgi:hypothetical protein